MAGLARGPAPGSRRRAVLTTAAVVVLRNAGELLPLQRLDTLRLATVKGRAQPSPANNEEMDFSWYLQHDILDYAPATPFAGPRPQDMARLRTHNLLLLSTRYKLVYVSIRGIIFSKIDISI